MGGWEAIGGGGKVEDALADLTGGVAGRFYTKVRRCGDRSKKSGGFIGIQ